MTHALLRSRLFLYVILVASLVVPADLLGQRTPAIQSPGSHIIESAPMDRDTARKGNEHIVTDVVRKVDSLQLVIVYNADLVRNDLNNKLIWIYILLAGMVVSNVMMYAAFNQIRKQSQDAEDGLKIQLSELQGKTSTIAKNLEPTATAAGQKLLRKPSRSRPKSGKRT